MVADLAGSDAARAELALAEANGDLKLAILLASGHTLAKAHALLARHAGNLRKALADPLSLSSRGGG